MRAGSQVGFADAAWSTLAYSAAIGESQNMMNSKSVVPPRQKPQKRDLDDPAS